MVLGYNEPRPTAADYRTFLDTFLKGLEMLHEPRIGFMGYGSYFRDDFTPGISDIDAALIIPADVVTNRVLTRALGNVIARALDNTHVPFQLSPTDTTIIRDGRFHSYTKDFLDYFLQFGCVLFGPDYRHEMVCLDQKSGPLSTVSHNLRSVRKSLLLAPHYHRVDPEAFVGKFESTLKAVSSSARQIVFLANGDLPRDRFTLLDVIPALFPAVNTDPLARIKHLYKHLPELDQLYRNPRQAFALWEEAVTFLEELVMAFIRTHPRSDAVASAPLEARVSSS